jgi:GNAT superfamily N-acetyltransferase
VALTDEGAGLATLRWFVLDPGLRGRGLGRRLLAEVLETARDAGYERIGLETFSDLRAAAHLYRSFGFELLWSQTGPRWGREEIVYQRYELTFQDRAQERSSRSAGSRERPFSVRA